MFLAVQRFTIPGTTQEKYITELSALALSESSGGAIADLAAKPESESSIAENLRRSAIWVHRCMYDDEACTQPTFDSPEKVLASLSTGQINAAVTVIVELSGLGVLERQAASRFRDGQGDAGSVPGASDREGVRDPAVGAVSGKSG